VAVVNLHPVIESMHGKVGNVVFVKRKGTQFMRKYVIPRDPETEVQLKNRSAFSRCVAKWQLLPQNEKDVWNQYGKTRNRRGYNLFISHHMKVIKNDGIPQSGERIFEVEKTPPHPLAGVSHHNKIWGFVKGALPP
jgi:hypothetical protein